MIYSSILKQLNTVKINKEKKVNVKIAPTVKQILDSSKEYPRETYNEIILKLVSKRLPQFSFEEVTILARKESITMKRESRE